MLFLVGKKIREHVESRKPRLLDTTHDSIPSSSNFCIKQMVSFNFYLISGISSTYLIPDHQVQVDNLSEDYCLLCLTDCCYFSVPSRLDFFFKTWDDPLCNPAERVRIVGIKGTHCALVYFHYLKHQAFSSVPQSSKNILFWNSLYCVLLILGSVQLFPYVFVHFMYVVVRVTCLGHQSF